MQHVMAQMLLDIEAQPNAGEGRIALLEAISEQGSIAGAARALDISYRTAWDMVVQLNNLSTGAVVTTSSGGRTGGAAHVTALGRQLIDAYRVIEDETATMKDRVQRRLTGEGVDGLLRNITMRTTARNALRGTITRILHGQIDSEVILAVADVVEVAAMIPAYSVEDLGLAEGGEAIALIKSSFVILARDDNIGRTSARNRLSGVITRREDTAISSEIELDLGQGKILAAVVTRSSAESLGLVEGDRACALFKSSHVILAVD